MWQQPCQRLFNSVGACVWQEGRKRRKKWKNELKLVWKERNAAEHDLSFVIIWDELFKSQSILTVNWDLCCFSQIHQTTMGFCLQTNPNLPYWYSCLFYVLANSCINDTIGFFPSVQQLKIICEPPLKESKQFIRQLKNLEGSPANLVINPC